MTPARGSQAAPSRTPAPRAPVPSFFGPERSWSHTRGVVHGNPWRRQPWPMLRRLCKWFILPAQCSRFSCRSCALVVGPVGDFPPWTCWNCGETTMMLVQHEDPV